MGGMSGFNMMYPYHWFATNGDPTGDQNFHQAHGVDGNFYNNQILSNNPAGSANPSGAASVSVVPGATGAAAPIGAYAEYNNASLQNPGSQQPLTSSPALMNGPQQGPWHFSAYNRQIPNNYISAAPPWKNGPMQHAASSLPAHAQAAVHATGSNPPTIAVAAPTPAATRSGTCAGCSGGCGGGGGSKSFCTGKGSHQALQLDSTNDFPPLYSHYQASPTQTVNAQLYAGVSTHTPAWTVAQGVQSDMHEPLQGM